MVSEGYVDVASISLTPLNVFNNSNVELTCRINTVGYPSDASFLYWWTFNDVTITPTSVSRYTVLNSVPEPLLYEQKVSTLRVSPILLANAGTKLKFKFK